MRAKFPRWTSRFLNSTRGQIILLLREQARTVTELAQLLDLTDNAVRAHLATLERDSLVRHSGERAGFRKPHFSYELTAEAEELFPKPYGRVLNRILAAFKERFGAELVEGVLRDVGRGLATGNIPPKKAALNERLDQALKLLEDFGGQARIERQDGRILIQAASCPLAAASADHPEVCRMVETLLSEIVGVPVRERCQRNPAPRCCFEMAFAKAVKASR